MPHDFGAALRWSWPLHGRRIGLQTMLLEHFEVSIDAIGCLLVAGGSTNVPDTTGAVIRSSTSARRPLRLLPNTLGIRGSSMPILHAGALARRAQRFSSTSVAQSCVRQPEARLSPPTTCASTVSYARVCVRSRSEAATCKHQYHSPVDARTCPMDGGRVREPRMRLSKYLVRQLGDPSVLMGHLLAPLWNHRNEALNDAALAQLALEHDDPVLEVGFGGGALLGKIASVAIDGMVAGVDVSPAMVVYCERHHRELIRNGRLQLVCAGADAIPFPDGHFSKICTVDSVFYWPTVPGALSEFWRLLQAGEALVMCFTCRESMESRRFAEHLRLYDPREIMDMMTSCGFQSLDVIQLSDQHRQFACVTCKKSSPSQ